MAPKAVQAIRVAKTLSALHPLVSATVEDLRSDTREKGGLRVACRGRVLSVKVSEPLITRAALILDAVVKRLEKLGHEVSIKEEWGRDSTTWARFGDVQVRFWLRERVRQTRHALTPKEEAKKRAGEYFYAPGYDYTPTGELHLGLGRTGYKEVTWHDREDCRLEEQLGEFVAGMYVAAGEERAKQARWAEEGRQYEKARQLALEVERLRQAEQARVEKLFELARSWRMAQDVRDFVAALERAAVEPGLHGEAITEWIAWARQAADRTDPAQRPEAVLEACRLDHYPPGP